MQGPAKKPPLGIFPFLVAATLGVFLWLIQFVFFKAPVAQAEAGGLAQKIFYFHVPSAYAMYLCGVVCLVSSVAYRVGPGSTALFL